MTDAWFEATADLLYRTQQTRGDQLPAAVTAAMRRLGVRTTLFLVDQEQQMLRMLPQAGAAMVDPMPVEGTLAGRAFSVVETVIGRDGADWRLWVPLLDGTDRLGVMEIRPLEPAPPPDPEQCGRYELLANLIGHLTVIHLPHGDMLVQARRSRPMSVTSELLWRLLPPLTFTCQEMVISAVLEPCYEVGGDAFDYAVDGSLARMAILDATGHDLSAGVTCSVGLAAIRATRRDGGGLCAMGRAVDAAIAASSPTPASPPPYWPSWTSRRDGCGTSTRDIHHRC